MKKAAASPWCSRTSRIAVIAILALALSLGSGRAAACVGDCDGDGSVPVNELITMVNIALGSADISGCMAGDVDASGSITVNEIITAVNNALNGCGPPPPEGPCGDNIVDGEEECDDGGICIGGTNAGAVCAGDAQCPGEGVCVDGSKAEAVCAADSDCPGGQCVRCKTFGGDGCAANCTTEREVSVGLVPGVVQGNDIVPGTSGAVVHADILTIPFPLSGTQTLVVGAARNGKIPIVVKLNSLPFPRIPASTLACACLRSVAYRTCGGTALEADGTTPATNCTPGFTAGDSECTGKKPCTYLFGPANSGVGTIGCSSLENTDYITTQDAGGSGPPGPRTVVTSGVGGPGSATIETTNAIGTVQRAASQVNPCEVPPGTQIEQYGADGQFCTDDDPQTVRGTTVPTLSVTGTASAQLLNTNGIDGNDIGPHSIGGAPFSCSALSGDTPTATGAALAGAGPLLGQPTVGDVVVTTLLVAQ